MNAEILCVGTELLLGDVVNTNAAYIASGLAHLGINVYHQAVVGDNPGRLRDCLEEAFFRSDVVILTGGLGPTYDDLTKETVARYFDRELEMDEDCLRTLEGFFARVGREMTENNRKQAMMPKGCIVLPNPNGTAPGCIIEGKGKVAVMMPGPPREMCPMFDGPVTDYFQSKTDGVLVSKTINFFGIGESTLEHELRDLMLSSTNPTIAPYAKPTEVQLRVTARAATEEEGYRLIEPVVQQIAERYPKEIYGYGFQQIHEGAVKILAEKGLTLATAESCTGGLIASRMIEIPGASSVVKCGIVAYNNEMKQKLLGVSSQTLEQHTEVSAECALEMARNVRAIAGASIGLGVTGVAGPGGGTEEKPVGLVYVAAVSDAGEQVMELHLARGRADDRETVRMMSSSRAMFMAIQMAKKL